MDAQVIRRVVQGLGANTYGQVVTVIIQLVGVPILLHAWGTQLYGEWLILFAIPAYLSMADLGFSQSAGNDMTARVACGDRLGAVSIFQSLVALVYTVSVLGLIVSVLLIGFLPLQDWLHFKAMDATTAQLVLGLLVAGVFVRLPNGVTHAGFRCTGEYALHVGLGSTTRLLQFSGVWIAALVGGGPVAAAAAFFGIQALATPALAMLMVYRHGWLRFGLKHARMRELRRLFKPALANIAVPFAQALNIQGMVLVVGTMLGPLAVVVFSTLRTLTRLSLQLVVAVSCAAEPELAAAYATGDRLLMQTLFVHVLRAGLWLALSAAVLLGLFGSLILDVWTHGKVSMDYELFAWLIASAIASVLWYSSLILLRAANLHLRVASLYVLASATSIGIATLLVAWTGNVASVGFALLIADIAMIFYTLNSTSQLGINSTASLVQAANPRPLLGLAFGKVRIH